MSTVSPFLLESQTHLAEQVVEFNHYLIRYVHPSWLEEIKLASLVTKLEKKGGEDYLLSSYLLREFHLESEFDYDFSDIHKRAALIGGKQLVQLCMYIGVVLNESVFRNIVKKSERTLLKQCLGEDVCRFAVKKAQFISRLGEHSGPCLLIDWDNLGSFRKYLVGIGLHVLGCGLANYPVGFFRRLELKLPRSFGQLLHKGKPNGLSSDQCKRLIEKTCREVVG